MEVTHKTKNRITIWSSSYTFEYFPKENKNTNLKIMHPMFTAAVFIIDNGSKLTTNRWMDKEKVDIYVIEYY